MRPLTVDVTEGPREDILGCVRRFPGVHLRSIERKTELPLGQVLYHLDRLERMGLIVSQRDAGFRRYYVAGRFARTEKPVLGALRHELPRRILVHLLRESPLSHKQLQERLRVAGSTLSFHLGRLLANNLVDRDRQGTTNLYSIVNPDLVRREIILFRESFQDEQVDRYVREALQALPAAEPS